MNNLQLLELKPTELAAKLSEVEEQFQQYVQTLDKVWIQSATTLLENFSKETRSLLHHAEMQAMKVKSTTDITIIREREAIFNKLLQACLSTERHFTGFPEAIPLLQCLEKVIYHLQADTKLFSSVALINGAKFREYDPELMQQKVSGFLALAETVDFFRDYLHADNLERIAQIAQQMIQISSRTVHNYADTDPERLKLETQIRSASYLIVNTIQNRSAKNDATPLPQFRSSHDNSDQSKDTDQPKDAVQSQDADCEAFIAAFADVLTPQDIEQLRAGTPRYPHRKSDNGIQSSKISAEQDWDMFMTFLEDSQDDMGISDLAHQHDHYLHGAPKRLEN